MKAKFNGKTDLPRSELQEMTLTEQFGSSDGVTIGAAFSSSCKMTMYKQEGLALKNGYFTPYVGLKAAGDNEVTYTRRVCFTCLQTA